MFLGQLLYLPYINNATKKSPTGPVDFVFVHGILDTSSWEWPDGRSIAVVLTFYFFYNSNHFTLLEPWVLSDRYALALAYELKHALSYFQTLGLIHKISRPPTSQTDYWLEIQKSKGGECVVVVLQYVYKQRVMIYIQLILHFLFITLFYVEEI